MSTLTIKDRIMTFMQAQSYAPLNAEDLIDQLPVAGSELKAFWTALSELEANGDIVKTRFKTYGLPREMGLVVGRFQLTSKGFGFVIPDNKGDAPDVFVPPSALNGAMNNDRVMARVASKQNGENPEGEIIRIIIHANPRVVGTFMPNGDFGFVVPDDKKIGQDIYIARADFNGAKAKQKVVATITVWPENRRSAEGKVTEILGSVGDVGLEIVSIIKQNDLPLEFPPKVLKAADGVPQTIKKSEITNRVDKRGFTIVTVDGEDAKDLDDAVYVEKQGKDYLLGVYIADVSYYVTENSVLDQEARERGTSVYLVDRVLPMLPFTLSNGICSLNEGQDRLVMACEMLLDGESGLVKAYDIFPSIIRSAHRLTYTSVRKILVEDDAELKARYQDIVPMLHNMEDLCKILRGKRERRGAIDFEIPEQKVILDENKKPVEIVQRERSIAERIIEEFMLAANETVAEHMSRQDWPFIYRVHDEPDHGKMTDLSRLLHNFNVNLPIADNITPLMVQKALSQMAGRPEERLVSTVTLRSLKQAVYQTENVGHFGLAAKYYTHFTSPIRRYPDLIVHRLLRSWQQNHTLNQKQRTKLAPQLEEIALHASVKERAAAEAERATVDLKKVEYMAGFVGKEFPGVISGVTSFGMFVELENGVEGLVHISSLTDDYYVFAEDNYALIGRHLKKVYRLGDKVEIEVLQVNIADRNIDFVMAGEDTARKIQIKNQLDSKREAQDNAHKNKGGAYFSTMKEKKRSGRKDTRKKKGGKQRGERQAHKNRSRK